MGVTNGTDPLGVFARRIALVNKIAAMDTDLATARANFAARKADWHTVNDLILVQQDLVRQRDLLPSTQFGRITYQRVFLRTRLIVAESFRDFGSPRVSRGRKKPGGITFVAWTSGMAAFCMHF